MTILLHDTSGVADTRSVRQERKFYLAPDKVELAYGLLRTICHPDRDYPVEEINSLYFDTPGLDELEHSLAGDFNKNKVRIRWYSISNSCDGLATVFLEIKSRQGFASTKQRYKIEVLPEKLEPCHLVSGIVARGMLGSTLAAFGFFPVKPLLPVIKISYLRFRFRDVSTSYSVALDCHIRSTPARPDLGHGENELELSGAVLEIKGREIELPVFLRKLRFLDIEWSQYSKYSACLGAHRDRLGAVGRLSPSGRNVLDIPVVLRESGHAGIRSRTEQDWNELFRLAV